MNSYQTYEEDSVEPRLGAPFFQEHLARYLFASRFVQDKRVLELGCGKGYGSFYLAHFANQVIGCDLNHKSLAFAKEHYQRANLRFLSHDVNQKDAFGVLGAPFDVIVSHEVIEHIHPSQTPLFLSAVVSLLKEDGILLLSTPNHEVVTKSGMPVPEFHINNFTASELKTTLLGYFGRVTLYGQTINRGWLKNLIYGVDLWHLRHRFLAKWIRRQISEPGEPAAPSYHSTSYWRPEQGFNGANHYIFSRWLWKQAGMTYAVCQLPKKP